MVQGRGRQRDHSISLSSTRKAKWGVVLRYLGKRRCRVPSSAASAIDVIQRVAWTYVGERDELRRYLHRFTKADLLRVVNATGWGRYSTERNRYSCSPILVTRLLLRRLTSPARWRDMELLFGRHAAQLSEMFSEGVEVFLERRGHLLLDEIDTTFIEQRAATYAAAIYGKCAMDNCVGFIDGTVIEIARPNRNEVQSVAYNGHKRKHDLKFQAVTAPDGLLLHVAGPIQGRRHDWTLYRRSGLDESLQELLFVDGTQYALYGDSGYNERAFLEVPFQGSQLASYQSAFNKGVAGGRVTVEWFFKKVKLYWSTKDVLCSTTKGK